MFIVNNVFSKFISIYIACKIDVVYLHNKEAYFVFGCGI